MGNKPVKPENYKERAKNIYYNTLVWWQGDLRPSWNERPKNHMKSKITLYEILRSALRKDLNRWEYYFHCWETESSNKKYFTDYLLIMLSKKVFHKLCKTGGFHFDIYLYDFYTNIFLFQFFMKTNYQVNFPEPNIIMVCLGENLFKIIYPFRE